MFRLSALSLAALLLAAVPLARADDAPHRCAYKLAARLPIRYVGHGLQPAVEGAINGTPATLLLDTGAQASYLTMTAALKRNLPLFPSHELIAGVGGLSRVYTTRLEEFAIGPARVRRMEPNVIYSMSFPPAFDGLLGANFLFEFDLELDLRANQFRWFEPNDCSHARLSIWKQDNTISVPFEGTRDRSANPHFSVLINGERVDAEIDSGASVSFLTLAAAKRIGLDVNGKDARKAGEVGGIGGARATRWNVKTASVSIGDETIREQAIDVIDTQARTPAELFLGQDFLRAHHVLFAMSQQKLYIAYMGGDVFSSRSEWENLVRREADAGHPDAQYDMARGAASGSEQARAWLDKAAAGGQPNAILEQGRLLLEDGQYAAAAAKLRDGLNLLPADRYAPLHLYLARMRTGQPELARSELAALVEKQHSDDWPAPIHDFYLGRGDPARLLAAAGDDAAHRCEARGFIADWYAARGDMAQADAQRAAAKGDCPAGAAKP